MNLFIKLLSSGILVQILTIISTLIFSRIFAADEFGDLAFYVSFGSLMAVIGGLRFDYLILKESIKNKEVGYLLSNVISISFNVTIIITIYLLQLIFNILNNINIIYLGAFGLGFSCFNNISQYLIAKKNYVLFIKLRLIQVIGVFSFVLSIKYIFNLPNSMLYGYSLSQLLLGLGGMLYIYSYIDYKNSLRRKIYLFFRANINESFKNFMISTMQYSSPLVPVFIGSYLYEQKNIGAYFIFAQMISAPLNIFRRNILILLNGEFSSKEKFTKSVRTKILTFRNIALFILALALTSFICFYFKQQIVKLTLGNQWVQYAYLLLPLSIYFLLDCILQPFTTLLPLWGKTNFSLGIETIRFFLLITILPIATVYLELSFLNFLIFYIAIMISAYMVITYKVLYFSKKNGN